MREVERLVEAVKEYLTGLEDIHTGPCDDHKRLCAIREIVAAVEAQKEVREKEAAFINAAINRRRGPVPGLSFEERTKQMCALIEEYEENLKPLFETRAAGQGEGGTNG